MPLTGAALESTVANVVGELGRGVVSAYLFGSQAEGRGHRESDVDIGVLLARDVSPRPADRFEVRLRLSGRLQAIVGRPVDVVVLNDVPPHLVRHVMTRGRQVLVTDAGADHAHRRTALSRAADLDPFLKRMRRIKLAALAR